METYIKIIQLHKISMLIIRKSEEIEENNKESIKINIDVKR